MLLHIDEGEKGTEPFQMRLRSLHKHAENIVILSTARGRSRAEQGWRRLNKAFLTKWNFQTLGFHF